ncbi:MAG: phospholipase C, phosphocholine-specific [Comamonadaceae bacterium]
MTHSHRRQFLRNSVTTVGAAAALSLFPPAIRKALAIDAQRETGTLRDVAHIVVLMQENRSFDHYFGSLKGVRGFADRFAIPMQGDNPSQPRQVWQQSRVDGLGAGVVQPFHLNTLQDFALMRAEGAAHTWPDAQQAWADGKLSQWTQAKGEHAMGYFAQADLPFHYALADAFTLCDAYHCSFQGGTTPNRLFLWTGTNDPHGLGHGPATFNDLESLQAKPGRDSYTWTTYPQRLQAAGVSWQVYQDINDNYDDNSLAFFKVFRDAYADLPGTSAELKARASSTRNLDQLKADVLANQLPQVSWIVANELGSEHPGQSSPAQGADYTARVLAALTANPEVWSRTVLILNYDENDGFFDHMPPPAVPSYVAWDADPAQALLAGASTVDTSGEYHENLINYRSSAQDKALLHHPYGLGPRVPMLVISPWSRGGWVNSQVFDHTSVIRFMEQRFGVMEPNISSWRRAVCGDLTSTLDFTRPERSALPTLPGTAALAARASALPQRTMPTVPLVPETPVAKMQAPGVRRSRALPYQLHVHSAGQSATQVLQLEFVNSGSQAAVFHVYDRLNLAQIPRRYTVEPGRQLVDSWALAAQGGSYDLWLLGPNGFHRHFTGQVNALPAAPRPDPEIEIGYDLVKGELTVRLHNRGHVACTFELQANAYFDTKMVLLRVAAQREVRHTWPIKQSGYWYDFTLRVMELAGFTRRFAGRMETGKASISDPAMGAMTPPPQRY